MKRAVAAVSAAFLASAPIAARAEPTLRAPSLSWVRLPGAESCVGPRALATMVERRLEREVLVPPARAEMTIEGRIERAPEGFRATITVSSESGAPMGTRELRSSAPSCAAMDDELALVIAVMIDPEAVLSPGLPEPPRPTPPPPPPAPRIVVEKVPVPVPCPAPSPPPASWKASVQLGAVTALGLLPRAGGGIEIRSRVVPPRFWAFEIGGVFFLPNDARQGTLGASFQLAWASLRACPLTTRAFGAELSACAGIDAGAIRASGFGFDLNRTQEQGVLDVALEGRVRRRIVGPLVVAGGLGLVFPVLRDRFYYLDAGKAQREVFQISPVAGEADLALGVEFP